MRVAVEGFSHSSVRICKEEGKGRQWEGTIVSSEQAFASKTSQSIQGTFEEDPSENLSES